MRHGKPESLLQGASINGEYRGQTVHLTAYGQRPTKLIITLTLKYRNQVSLLLEQRGIVNTLMKAGETTIETGNRKFDQSRYT